MDSHKVILFISTLFSTCGAYSVYEASNAFCSQTPTIYPFEGGYQLDGTYTLIRYSDIDYTPFGEEPPECGTLTIESVSSQLDFVNNKTLTTTRTHPFEKDSSFTKTMNAIQTNKIITPGRWVAPMGLFQFVPGPLGATRSLMFLKYARSTSTSQVESFLYASCGMLPNGGVYGPGVGDPAMAEWGILVRAGSEDEDRYKDEAYLSYLYEEALQLANLPPLWNMTVIKPDTSGKCIRNTS